MKKVLALILAVVMCFALLAGCGEKPAEPAPAPAPAPAAPSIDAGDDDITMEVIEAEQYKEKVRIGGQIDIPTLDFHEALNAYYLILLTHDTLIVNNNGKFAPSLATEWTQVDATTFEFKLREGVTFHDGSPFTAEDVVFTFERGLAAPASAMASKVTCIDKVEALDDYTVRFTLNTANQDFLIYLGSAYCSIMSKTALEKDPEGYKYGTGPWVNSEFVPNISSTMVRNENFWGELPKTKVMEYIVYPEDAARFVALQAGEVDLCFRADAADYDALLADENLTPISIRDSGFALVAFDQRDPLLADINLRKAICYAINPEDVYAVSQNGYGEVAVSFWGAGCYGETEDIEGYYYDPDLAKEYLAKSSYNGEELKILCGVKMYVENAVVYADCLREIGINCVLDEKDFVGVISGAGFNSEPHQLVSFGATWADLPDHVRNYTYEGKSNNYTCVAHPELQEMIDKALVETDDATRKDMYRQIQQYILDNALYLPVYRSIYYCAQNKNLGGMVWGSDVYSWNARNACVAITD